MLLKSILLAAGLASPSLALSGTILSQFRNTVGPATRAACGEGIANFLATNPTADLLTVQSHQDSGYNAAACNLQQCGGFQFADSPASKTLHITSSQVANVTVEYETPSTPLDDRDYYDIYVPTLTLYNTTGGYGLLEPFDYDSVANNTAQVLSYLAIDDINSRNWADIPSGTCSQAGHCAFSYQFVNFFRQPALVSNRNVYAGCVDVVISWS